MQKSLILLLFFLAGCSSCSHSTNAYSYHAVDMRVKTVTSPPKVVTKDGLQAPQTVAEKALQFYKPIDETTPMIELKEFNKNTVTGFLEKLQELDGKTKEIWVRIDTMGGSIMGGQDIIHGLEAAKSNIVCVADWKAYSMGFYVLESPGCDWRLMTQRASLMAHEPATSSAGNAGELRDDADLLDALNEGFLVTASERMKMTVEAFRAKTERRTWWLSYSAAEKYHAVDGWVSPKSMPAPTAYEVKKSFLEQLLGG